MREMANSSSSLLEEISEVMGTQYDKIKVQEQGIIQTVDLEYIDGNNRKYLELYDKIAPLYRLANTCYFIWKFGGEKKYRSEFLSELAIKKNDKVLETSVGAADNFRYLPGDVTLYGLDISFRMLKQAKKNMKKWKRHAYFFQANAEVLPFKDNSFDVVFHVGGINFFNDKQAAISEMIRVAKSGTKIVIVDETEKLIETTYKKTPITKQYYQEDKQIGAPLELIPSEMHDIQCREICNGLMYCLTFKKP